jgi:hypothetical protein
MRKTIAIKDTFSRSLRKCLQEHYGRVPAAAVIARDFNLRAYGVDPITQESARRWIRGISIPEEDRLKVLIEWLSLDFNGVLCSNANGNSHARAGDGDAIPREMSSGNGDGLSIPDEELVRLFFSLDEERKRLILELIKQMTL